MLFLIDKNTTFSIQILFERKGFAAECVRDMSELRATKKLKV
jgi:hypothetical protein